MTVARTVLQPGATWQVSASVCLVCLQRSTEKIRDYHHLMPSQNIKILKRGFIPFKNQSEDGPISAIQVPNQTHDVFHSRDCSPAYDQSRVFLVMQFAIVV